MNFHEFRYHATDGSVDDMLDAHDRARHGGHFNPETMTCKLRDEIESDVLSPKSNGRTPSVVGMVDVFKRWLPGREVEIVSREDAKRHKDEAKRIGLRGTRFSVKSDNMRGVVLLKDDPFMWEKGYQRAATGVPDIIAECMGLAFGTQGVKADKLANTEVRVYRSFWHCMEPSNLSERGYFDGKNGHDVTADEASDAVKAITRPIAVLRPNKMNQDAIRVICEMPNGNGDRKYMVIAVKKGDGDGNGYVSILTMFPFSDDYARGIGPNDFLYLDKKRTQGLRAPTMLVRQLAAFRRSSSMGSVPLTEEDFVEENGDIIARNRSTSNATAEKLIEEYNRILQKEGNVPKARDVFWKYAKLKGWERKFDKRLGMTVLVSKEGRKKSDDIEPNGNGYLIPIEERLNDNLPRGDEKAWREGKKTEAARQFDYYFRHFVDEDGQIAGWYDRETGNVALVDGVATAETVAHEIGWHATFHWAETHHPKLYEKLMQYAREATDGIKLSVAEKYGAELTEKELLDEIGAERFTREDISELLDVAERRVANGWFDKVETAQDEARRDFIADQTNGGGTAKFVDVDRIAELTPKEAVKALAKAMLRGETLAAQDGGIERKEPVQMKTKNASAVVVDEYFNPAVTADVICIRTWGGDSGENARTQDRHEDGKQPLIGPQEVLLIQRGEEPDKGMWAFPGGHMEADDESIETAALRELKEETGLVAKELRPVGVLSQQSEMDNKPCICHVFVYPFWADGGAGDEAKAADDARNATWFKIGVSYLRSQDRYRVELTATDGKEKGKKIVFTVRTRHNPIGFMETDVVWDDSRTTAGRMAFDHANMLSRALLQCPTFLNVAVTD